MGSLPWRKMSPIHYLPTSKLLYCHLNLGFLKYGISRQDRSIDHIHTHVTSLLGNGATNGIQCRVSWNVEGRIMALGQFLASHSLRRNS